MRGARGPGAKRRQFSAAFPSGWRHLWVCAAVSLTGTSSPTGWPSVEKISFSRRPVIGLRIKHGRKVLMRLYTAVLRACQEVRRQFSAAFPSGWRHLRVCAAVSLPGTSSPTGWASLENVSFSRRPVIRLRIKHGRKVLMRLYTAVLRACQEVRRQFSAAFPSGWRHLWVCAAIPLPGTSSPTGWASLENVSFSRSDNCGRRRP